MTYLALILAVGLFGPVTETNPSLLGPGDDPPVLIALRTNRAISIDGMLNEEDWQMAPFASGFLQFEPIEGDAPSQKTEVRMLYGDDAIYIGATMHDTNPEEIWRTLGRRDNLNKADWFIVSIDGYLNRKEASSFAVNAAGVQLDGVTTHELNTSWNAVWESSVRVTNSGWIVEIRIPYSMLRFSDARLQSWGLNFQRIIPRTGEGSPRRVPRSQSGTPHRHAGAPGRTPRAPARRASAEPRPER